MGSEIISQERPDLTLEHFYRDFSMEDMVEQNDYQINLAIEGLDEARARNEAKAEARASGEDKTEPEDEIEAGLKKLIRNPVSDKFKQHFPDTYQYLLTSIETYDDIEVTNETDSYSMYDRIMKDPLIQQLEEYKAKVTPKGMISKSAAEDANFMKQSYTLAIRARRHTLAYLYIESPASPKSIERTSKEDSDTGQGDDLKDAM